MGQHDDFLDLVCRSPSAGEAERGGASRSRETSRARRRHGGRR
jgi:hypothetical protein